MLKMCHTCQCLIEVPNIVSRILRLFVIIGQLGLNSINNFFKSLVDIVLIDK